MKVKNINTELEKAPLEPNAGIRLVKITGNEQLSIYAAEISPKTKLNAHYHKVGIETFHILKGKGIMKMGVIGHDGVEWEDNFEVRAGDCFTIKVDVVHQLLNHTDYPLQAVFATPESHTKGDRYFIVNND